jgi:hypothetical protein
MLGELTQTDIIQRLRPAFDAGWYIRPEDGKVVMPQAGIFHENAWVFIKQPTDEDGMFCKYFHDICHKCFNLIPSRCMSCWKVVFRPKTVAELFTMMGVMQNDLSDINCKLGEERRSYVFGNYGCYFYGRSKEEGLENYERIRKAVANSPKLRHLLKAKDNKGRTKNLILKRACTEFEMSHGDSDKWAHSEADQYWERRLNETVEKPNTYQPQPDYVKDHIMRGWLKFAYDRGDVTALQFNDGQMFYPDYVKYHPGGK